jgi:hypothetical protein
VRDVTISAKTDEEPLRVDADQPPFGSKPINEVIVAEVSAAISGPEESNDLRPCQAVEPPTSNERANHLQPDPDIRAFDLPPGSRLKVSNR